MRLLRVGSTGEDVQKWEHFLVGLGLLKVADGVFDQFTKAATIEFQKMAKMTPDGFVGNGTFGKAMQMGFELVEDTVPETDEGGANWPPMPNFRTWSEADTEKYLGKIEFEAGEKGMVKITNGWDKENIITINIPQLNKIGQKWGHKNGDVLFHKKGAKQMIDLWDAWEKEGLLHLVTDFSGTYCPRFIRGSVTRLSNHSFGTAFDINIKTNGLGVMPPFKGKPGSVRELVPIANKFGFFWGGHYKNRKDGMHFEIAKML